MRGLVPQLGATSYPSGPAYINVGWGNGGGVCGVCYPSGPAYINGRPVWAQAPQCASPAMSQPRPRKLTGLPSIRALRTRAQPKDTYDRMTLNELSDLLYHALVNDQDEARRSENVWKLIGVAGNQFLLVFRRLVDGQLFFGGTPEESLMSPVEAASLVEDDSGCGIS